MKASFKHIALMFAAGAFLAACNNGELDDPDSGKNNPQGDQTFEYLFSVNDAGLTRAVIEDDAIAFEEGDILVVIAKTPAKTSSTSAEVFFAEGGAKFAFSIKGQEGLKTGDAVYAWHPFSEENAATDPTNVTLTIPAEQEQTEADYNADAMPLVSAPFVAESTLPTGRKELAGEITMVPVGAVAEFNIYSTFPGFADQQIVSVTYTADGVSGNFNWDFTAEESAASGFTGNSITTTVQTTESVAATQADGAKVYMVLAPGERAASLMVKTTEAEYTLALASETYAAGQITAVDVNLEGAEWNVAKIYRYKFAATAEDELFGGLQDALGVFFGEETLSKELAESAFNIDKEEAVAANTTVAAYYPYTESAENATALALNIPTEQTNLADGGWDKSYIPVVAAPVALTGEANAAEPNGTLAFRSLAAVAEFKMHSTYANTVGEKIRSVTLAAAAGGNFTWDLTAERADDAAWAVTGLDGTSVKASLAAETLVGADAENATSVFMVLAPGTYSGNLTVTTDRTSYSYSLENETFAMGEAKEISIELPSSSSDFAMALEALDGLAPVPAEGDKMALYGKEQNKIECEYTADNSFATPDEANVKGPFFAVYPADATHSIDFETGVLTGNVPEVQTLGEDKNVCDDAFVYYATGNTPAFTFKNATAFVKVEVAIDNVSEIKLTAKEGQAIAGAFTMELGAESTTVTAAEGASNTATLKPYGETFAKGTYYIAVIPGASEDLTLDFKVKGAEDAEETFNRARTIENTVARNTITDLGLYFGYRIADAAQLLAWNNSNAEWTKWDIVTLTAHINCKDVITTDNWTMRTFTGTFDGNGKTIDYFVIEKADKAAFFDTLNGNALVKSLTFGENCSFTVTGSTSNRNRAGSLCIFVNEHSSLSEVTNRGSIKSVGTATGSSAGNYIGGICASVGSESDQTLLRCKNYGSITFSAIPEGWASLGGLVGEVAGTATLSYCENYGHIEFNGDKNNGYSINLGGISAGANKAATFSYCANYGTIRSNATNAAGGGTNIGGIIALNNTTALASITNCSNGSADNASLGKLVFDGKTSGPVRMGGCIGYIQEVGTSVGNFNNYGEVTVNGSTANGLYMGGVVGYMNPYNSDNTISLSNNYGPVQTLNTSSGECGIGGILGRYNPTATKKINDVDTPLTSANLTIESCTNSGIIKKDSTPTSNHHIGGIVGHTTNVANATADIKSCTNNGNVTNTSTTAATSGRWTYSGGIIGFAATSGEVNGCTNNGTIKNDVSEQGGSDHIRIGGIAGGGECGKFTNCTNNGEVIDNSQSQGGCVGGIIGCIKTRATTLTNCDNTKKITARFDSKEINVDAGNVYCGGVVGYCNQALTMTSCDNSGEVVTTTKTSANTYLGGVVGYCTSAAYDKTIDVKITNSINSGKVHTTCETSTNAHLGGIVGYVCGAKNSSTSKIAYITITAESCKNTAQVTENSGTTTTTAYMGGILGYAHSYCTLATIKTCENSSELLFKKTSHTGKLAIGGLVGFCYNNNIDGCKVLGNITNSCTTSKEKNEYIGGIAGQIENNVTSSITNSTIKSEITVKQPQNLYTEHYSGIIVGRLTDKLETTDSGNNCTTTISGISVLSGTKYDGIAINASNLGTYTFGQTSNYGGQKKTVGKTYATTGISYVEQ